MQIISTPALIEGIKAGTFTMMSTAAGTTGTVKSLITGKIAGQLRFTPAKIAYIITPMALWQIAHIMTGVRQLAKITERLDSLQRGNDENTYRLQAKAYGRLFGAITSLNEIDGQFQSIWYFSDDMTTRLSIATQEIYNVFNEQSFKINRFIEEPKDIIDKTKNEEWANSANTMLKERAHKFLVDVDLYTAAAEAEILSSNIWLKHDLQKVPEYAYCKNEAIKERIHQVEEKLIECSIYDELKEHSDKCLDDMVWFSRNILNRGLRNDIQNRKEVKSSILGPIRFFV
jgi:hypothetical protein